MLSIVTRLVAFAKTAAVISIASMLMNPALAQSPAARGWELEWGVETPTYAVIDPESTNLNIDSVVLACTAARSGRMGLQMQLYLSTAGPLAPDAVHQLKDDPRVEIIVDGASLPVGLFFADEYAVLADTVDIDVPLISDNVIDAMQAGRVMVLRFDLLAEGSGEPAMFDGSAVFDLQAGAGGGALSALRRCTASLAAWPVGHLHE